MDDKQRWRRRVVSGLASIFAVLAAGAASVAADTLSSIWQERRR